MRIPEVAPWAHTPDDRPVVIHIANRTIAPRFTICQQELAAVDEGALSLGDAAWLEDYGPRPSLPALASCCPTCLEGLAEARFDDDPTVD